MPRLLQGAAVLVLAGLATGGCTVARKPLVTIEPEYSLVRDGERAVETLATADAELSVDTLASYLEANGLMEPALPAAAGQLVEADASPR